MRFSFRCACLLIVIIFLCRTPVVPNVIVEIVVATKQVELQTKTFLLKLPVEAQRGERWEVVKRSKSKITLTFGPTDARREMMKSFGMKKPPEYEINTDTFASAFVPESQWPEARKALASELQRRFNDLSIEECEKVIEGELWVGMKKAHAAEAVGNRVLQKEIRESQEGKSETWRIGAFSLITTSKITVKAYDFEETVTASPSKPMEPLDVKAKRDLESNTRSILTFKNDILTEIVRR